MILLYRVMTLIVDTYMFFEWQGHVSHAQSWVIGYTTVGLVQAIYKGKPVTPPFRQFQELFASVVVANTSTARTSSI